MDIPEIKEKILKPPSNIVSQEKEIKSLENSVVESGLSVIVIAITDRLFIGISILFIVLIVSKDKKTHSRRYV